MDQPVFILGAGIIGICTALSLAERGVAVRIIDRGEPGQETSFGNAGIISPWSVIPQSMPGVSRQIPQLMFGRAAPLSIRAAAWPKMIPWGLRFLQQASEARARATADVMEVLCAPSIDLYRRHLQGTGAESLIKDSIYVHAFRDGSRANLKSLDYAIRQEKGANLELVGSEALQATEPALSPAFNAAVLIHDQARALSPGGIGRVLAEKARGLGVDFITDNIRKLNRTDGAWQIVCDGGTHAASQVVVAMGAWSANLLAPLGLRMPLMAERGYHLEFAQPGIEIRNSVMDVDAKLVASSMEAGVRIAGQAEFAPVDAPPDDRKRGQLRKLAKAAFPDLNTGTESFWMGRRPSFPDSLPVLGEALEKKGLFLNFGHSHYGLMMAPKSGELLADMVIGRASNADVTALGAERFL
ncbi:FAD-dependent oxidoreductase [uncultured Roseobacter sp.]|uniref:NAD(P)/FAD-dependent oxidoreductase n=1 Tax=uncultured Roseobacter sp. TaxID=114847 RepID=UPI002611D214|nr:FAD-dependent oxidoreductase [uncultured Roseobacter sp.]